MKIQDILGSNKVLVVLLAINIVLIVGNMFMSDAYCLNCPDEAGEIPAMAESLSTADGDPVKGDPDAPVTIVEFSDFQCPYCGRFYRDTLPLIEENYVDTGKVKLVFKDFPLGFHDKAQEAAEAAECADEEGKFWEYHDMLFERTADWGSRGTAAFKEYAGELGLTGFDSCLDSGRMADEVREDMQEGSASGVTGTPAFLVNGQLVVGAQPYAVFQQAIELALAG